MTLTQQMSLRLTEAQRTFVREELAEMQRDPRAAKMCEADIVRAFIEQARQAKQHATIEHAEAGA